jgi:shikimate kinase
MPSRKLLFLIGPRGSGKSTVAALLAQSLNWAWVDADAVLERKAGCSIREMFAQQGETAFRSLEAAVLQELCALDKTVIATGGGVVLRAENRQRLRQAGPVVWLQADVETLWQRIRGDSSSAERRPPLQNVDAREEVALVLASREALYHECANEAFETAGRTPAEVAAEVLAWLTARGEAGAPC